MDSVKSISLYLIIGTALTILGLLLDSSFLYLYLCKNIVGLLLTLLAINTATSGLVASKMQDISTVHPGLDFSKGIKEMKKSLLEQIILIIVSVITLVLINSERVEFSYKETVGSIIISTVFVYAVAILWDTGKSVFIIIEEIQKLNKKK